MDLQKHQQERVPPQTNLGNVIGKKRLGVSSKLLQFLAKIFADMKIIRDLLILHSFIWGLAGAVQY